MARGVVLLAVVALLGCDNKPGRDKPSTAVPPVGPQSAAPIATAATPARPTDPTPDPITHPCVVDTARFKRALADRDDTCQADGDCGCYPGGMEGSGCGGVTSKKSVAVLSGIVDQFRKHGCKLPLNCAAWQCRPSCVDGQCRR